MDGEAIETVALRVVATVHVEKPSLREEPGETPSDPERRRMRVDEEWVEVPAYARDDLGAGSRLEGPCLVDFAEATLVVADGWSGRVDDAGTVVLER
jgi:N-methylhydantoinase A